MNLPTLPNFARQTGLLFGLDMAANLVDYACHVYLGRALAPGDFAVFQSANSLLLILAAIFGVMQPALARLVAEIQEGGGGEGVPGLFRLAFGWSAGAGLLLGAGIAAARAPLGVWFNLPVPRWRRGLAGRRSGQLPAANNTQAKKIWFSWLLPHLDGCGCRALSTPIQRLWQHSQQGQRELTTRAGRADPAINPPGKP
jgi:hypothetical protein